MEDYEFNLEERVQKLREVAEPYLTEISDDNKEEFYRFCSETEMGICFLRAEQYQESLMLWFGIFGEPFKRILFGSQFDNVLQTIWSLDYSQTPADLMLFRDENSAYYGFNKILSALYTDWYRYSQDEEKRISDPELFNLYAEAEQYCRRSMCQIGDYAFYNVMACLYLEAALLSEYEGNDDKIQEIAREMLSTYYNLSEREDLFNNEQQAILKMLNKLVQNLW